MAQNSKIEWTTHTINLWWGCTKVHAGCDHCYAETLSNRWGQKVWGNDKPRRIITSAFPDLIKYQELARKANEKHRVFVGSMMDIFEKPMPLVLIDGIPVINTSPNEPSAMDTGWLRDKFFKQISDGMYPNLIFLLLTKRPSNINKYIPKEWKKNPPSNVMFGTSPVNQETADKLIPQLMQVNGKRFLSIEPMLGEMNITNKGLRGGYDFPTQTDDDGKNPREWFEPGDNFIGIDWVINGGESGPHKRAFDLEWARSLRDQCKKAKVPFFFKQIDKVRDKIEGIPSDLMIREFPVI